MKARLYQFTSTSAKSALSATSLILVGLSAQNASAADAIFHSYDKASSGRDFWFFGPNTPEISNANYAAAGFLTTSDDQKTRWQNLLSTGYAYGSSTTLTRAHDISEDYAISWSTPTLDLTSSVRWEALTTNGSSSNTISNYNKAGSSGPFAGQYWRGNNNLIAVGDDHALLWNSARSQFTMYSLNGSLISNDGGLGVYNWTTLSGGAFGGQTLSASLLKSAFVGFEEGDIAFLSGADTLVYYNVTNGSFVRSQDYSTASVGPLAGSVTLADVIDGKVQDAYWVGLDSGPLIANVSIIPEPSASLLLSAGIGGLLIRRRKR